MREEQKLVKLQRLEVKLLIDLLVTQMQSVHDDLNIEDLGEMSSFVLSKHYRTLNGIRSKLQFSEIEIEEGAK
jgi:hypothetical protein